MAGKSHHHIRNNIQLPRSICQGSGEGSRLVSRPQRYIVDSLTSFRGVSTGPIQALDYWVYFLLALCQGHNNNYKDDGKEEGTKTLLLSQMTEQASMVAKEARANWFQYHYEITCPKSATGGLESLTSSLMHSPKNRSERRSERSPGHSREVSNSNWKQYSKPNTKNVRVGRRKAISPPQLLHRLESQRVLQESLPPGPRASRRRPLYMECKY